MTTPLSDEARRPLVEFGPMQAPPTLKHVVASRLRRAIFSGMLRSNQKIDQDQIARDIGVSKLPVREALISLESEGLVVNVARRGCFVAPLTRDDIYDHYVLIGMVSGRAAARAAGLVTEDDEATLRDLLDRLEAAGDAETQGHLNHLFHRHVNRLGGSRRLESALRLLTNTMPANFFEYASGWGDRARLEHELLFQALVAHDATAAESAMIRHMSSGAEVAVSIMEAAGFWDRPRS